jgi:hypothetical protein
MNKFAGDALASVGTALPITALLWLAGFVKAYGNAFTVFGALMTDGRARPACSPAFALVSVFIAVTLTAYYWFRG